MAYSSDLSAGPPLLEYTLLESPFQPARRKGLTKRNTLELVIGAGPFPPRPADRSGPRDRSIWCEEILLAIPFGSGPEDLTAKPDEITCSASSGDWRRRPQSSLSRYAIWAWTPGEGPATEFDGTWILLLSLDGIRRNRHAASVDLYICEHSAPVDPDTGRRLPYADYAAVVTLPTSTVFRPAFDLSPFEPVNSYPDWHLRRR